LARNICSETRVRNMPYGNFPLTISGVKAAPFQSTDVDMCEIFNEVLQSLVEKSVYLNRLQNEIRNTDFVPRYERVTVLSLVMKPLDNC
jgi:hypothetical protein